MRSRRGRWQHRSPQTRGQYWGEWVAAVLWTPYCPGPSQPLLAHPHHPQSDTKTSGRTLLLDPSPCLSCWTVTAGTGKLRHCAAEAGFGRDLGGDFSPPVTVVAQSRQHGCPGGAGGLALRHPALPADQVCPVGPALQGAAQGPSSGSGAGGPLGAEPRGVQGEDSEGELCA